MHEPKKTDRVALDAKTRLCHRPAKPQVKVPKPSEPAKLKANLSLEIRHARIMPWDG